MPDVLFMLDMVPDEPELVEAFAKVLEYRPFCRYRRKQLSGITITYEWAKNDAGSRFLKLQKDKDVYELKSLS